jgi:cellulose synthase/poly-beta-1,6-N-acetylglucosamine synthase-like glycosyltransferase
MYTAHIYGITDCVERMGHFKLNGGIRQRSNNTKVYRGVLKGNFDCIVVYLAIYSQTGLLPNRINVLRRTMLFRINRMFELSSYLNQISIINWYLTFVLFDLCLIPPLSLKCPILSTQSVIPYIWAVYIVYAISSQNCL